MTNPELDGSESGKNCFYSELTGERDLSVEQAPFRPLTESGFVAKEQGGVGGWKITKRKHRGYRFLAELS